jgi:hypothetical protein
MKPIDVAMMVYGKPYHTAVALHSLYKYSGHLINTIYVTFEKKQPFDVDTEILKELLEGLPVKYNVSERFFGPRDMSGPGLAQRLKFYIPSYRKSIKYQFAWEASRSPFLFVLHNDMLFSGDLLTYYLDQIQDDLAVGTVGQCWNCPAHGTLCDSHRYFEYRPNAAEIEKLYKVASNGRAVIQGVVGELGWPLPECRLNEYVTLFNLKKARPIGIPNGTVRPFGIHNNLDFGIPWFRDVSLRGYKFRHVSFDDYAVHGWTSQSAGGTPSLFNKDLYDWEEDQAIEKLKTIK